jgi:hypothetical protein
MQLNERIRNAIDRLKQKRTNNKAIALLKAINDMQNLDDKLVNEYQTQHYHVDSAVKSTRDDFEKCAAPNFGNVSGLVRGIQELKGDAEKLLDVAKSFDKNRRLLNEALLKAEEMGVSDNLEPRN